MIRQNEWLSRTYREIFNLEPNPGWSRNPKDSTECTSSSTWAKTYCNWYNVMQQSARLWHFPATSKLTKQPLPNFNSNQAQIINVSPSYRPPLAKPASWTLSSSTLDCRSRSRIQTRNCRQKDVLIKSLSEGSPEFDRTSSSHRAFDLKQTRTNPISVQTLWQILCAWFSNWADRWRENFGEE